MLLSTNAISFLEASGASFLARPFAGFDEVNLFAGREREFRKLWAFLDGVIAFRQATLANPNLDALTSERLPLLFSLPPECAAQMKTSLKLSQKRKRANKVAVEIHLEMLRSWSANGRQPEVKPDPQ